MTSYATIVADPPWPISWKPSLSPPTDRARGRQFKKPLPYKTMPLDAIANLPVKSFADRDSHLYLWTPNSFLENAYTVARRWGFTPINLLVWCKAPMGLGLGGTFSQTTEYVIFARRGSPKAKGRVDSTWWQWTRTDHSVKPEAFLDLVESVSPGPYLELFARRQRLGWDTWGNEALEHVEMSA